MPVNHRPVCREKAPGQRECDEAIEVLNGCIREVDQASLAAISQQLMPREDISMEVGASVLSFVLTRCSERGNICLMKLL